MDQNVVPFPPVEVAVRIVVAAGAGLLVGLEREWSHKDMGSRTFTIAGLFGGLAALISPAFAIAGMAAMIAVVLLTASYSIARREKVEPTTAAALMATFTMGVLAGEGHVFTPAAAAILMTLVLSLKPQLSKFAIGLKQEEVRGAVLLALIAFVIYPVLPSRAVDPWRLFNPREVWLTIILISAIGFVNYVLLRLLSGRGLYYTAIFGGLVNSTAAMAELSPLLEGVTEDAGAMIVAVNMLTVIAMFARNLILLAIFSPAAAICAMVPIGAMSASAAVMVWRQHSRVTSPGALKLGSPLDISRVVKFGALFLLIQAGSTVGQRLFGASGIVIASLLGGLASSASSTAAAATLASHGRVTPANAAACVVLASIASMTVNLPIIYRQFKDRRAVRRVAILSACIAAIGLGATAGIMKQI